MEPRDVENTGVDHRPHVVLRMVRASFTVEYLTQKIAADPSAGWEWTADEDRKHHFPTRAEAVAVADQFHAIAAPSETGPLPEPRHHAPAPDSSRHREATPEASAPSDVDLSTKIHIPSEQVFEDTNRRYPT